MAFHTLLWRAVLSMCLSQTRKSWSPHDSFIQVDSEGGVTCMYGVPTISRLLKIIGLFCKRALYKRLYSAKETYNFKEPTNRSHTVCTV